MKTSQTISSRQAFTMIELVFVIVVLGILSYMVASGFQRNTVVEAADQIVANIRYTQHLAMQDDKFQSATNQYYRERWNIRFATDSSGNGNWVYWIMSDRDRNGTDAKDYAKDPENSNTLLSGDSSLANRNLNFDLTRKYGITRVTNNCALVGGRIFFDYLGRPYNDTVFPATSVHQNLITVPCTIVIASGATTRTIEISPETGYVRHF